MHTVASAKMQTPPRENEPSRVGAGSW